MSRVIGLTSTMKILERVGATTLGQGQASLVPVSVPPVSTGLHVTAVEMKESPS